MRNNVSVIYVSNPDGSQIHFCSGILQGSNHEIWFPVNSNKEIFPQIERIMTLSHIANNVVQINITSKYKNGVGGTVHNLDVIYNEWDKNL